MDRIETAVDGRLWISNINSITRRGCRKHEIDYNLNLSFKPIDDRRRISDTTYEQIAFKDATAGADVQNQFDEAVSTTVRRIRETNDRIVVNCGAGVSRSAAVTATTIAVVEEIPFREALDHVSDARPSVDPYDAFRKYGIAYAADRTDS
jgi:predicted protein tyrosine phosphatase